MDDERTIRDKVCIIGVGETEYTKHGRIERPEFQLALEAILAACTDAGLDPKQLDGFASYANDRNDPTRIATALGVPEFGFGNMFWGGGGGGGLGGGRERRRGDRRGVRGLRGRVPGARAGAVRTVRASARRRADPRRPRLRHPLRHHDPRPALRHADPAAHARIRHHQRASRARRRRVL